jgi:subtilisin family serine protease
MAIHHRFYRAARHLCVEQLEDRALPSANFAPDELLVRFAGGVDQTARASMRSIVGATLIKEMGHVAVGVSSTGGTLERVRLTPGLSVQEAMGRFSAMSGVLYAEPNYVLTSQYVSNDTHYLSGALWGMYSDDSPTAIGPSGTTNIYGSQAEKAWNDGHIGSSTVYVGVIDEGFQYSHPDLDANSWTNPFDPVDGVDNDGNGRIDDVHGWDFFYNDNTTYDGTDDDHGTHVAGTIGGEGGNAIGVAGVNWNVTMISAKFLGPGGGYISGAIDAVNYLTDLKTRHGLNIVATNNSWGGGGYSQGLHDAIIRAAKAGILFVAAAGNSSSNNDNGPFYPSNYSTLIGTSTETAATYEAVIAVASITSTGALSSFSSYGATTVDLGAPGSSVTSTLPVDSYGSYSGTSMATPHVTGAAALYASRYPTATAKEIRDAILVSATPTASLSGKTATGGRLNVWGALQIAPGIGISISDVTHAEGTGATTTFTFNVTLSSASNNTIMVDFDTDDGTATIAGGDYVSNSGTLEFAPGDTLKTVSVAVNADSLVESNESFFVLLSNATGGATIADDRGQGTIQNDDFAVPTISITDVSLTEGNKSFKNFNFVVTLSASSAQTVTVNYATANGTATTANNDYSSKSGTLSFSPGTTSLTVSVRVRGDRTVEPNETFYVNLSGATNAVIGDSQGLGTIVNDDGGGGSGDGSAAFVPDSGNSSATEVAPSDSKAFRVKALPPAADFGETTAPPPPGSGYMAFITDSDRSNSDGYLFEPILVSSRPRRGPLQ